MAGLPRIVAWLAVLAAAAADPPRVTASDAPLLRSATVQVVWTSPTTCEVDLSLETTAGDAVDHRIEARDDTGITLLGLRDAVSEGEPRQVGVTRSIRLRAAPGSRYGLQYRVQQTDERAYRCPLWIPALATDGRSRAISLVVRVPDGPPPGSTFPAFTWRGNEGRATLGHLPSMIRVPYDHVPGWHLRTLDVTRTMDATALVVLAAATGLFIWRRTRG